MDDTANALEDMVLNELYSKFVADKKSSMNAITVRRIMRDYEKWLSGHFGDKMVKDIESSCVIDFGIALLMKKTRDYQGQPVDVSVDLVYRIKLSLQTILEYGVELGVIKDNPCKQCNALFVQRDSRKKTKPRIVNIPDKAQLKKMFDKALQREAENRVLQRYCLFGSVYFYLAVKTRLNFGDIVNITWGSFICDSASIDWKSDQLKDNNYGGVVLSTHGMVVEIEPIGAKLLDTSAKWLKKDIKDDDPVVTFRSPIISRWLHEFSHISDLPEITKASLHKLRKEDCDIFNDFDIDKSYPLITPKKKKKV